jgi:hypothetical protein
MVPWLPPAKLAVGAKMLRVAVAFDNLTMRGLSNAEAIDRLQHRADFDRELAGALADIKPQAAKMELRKISISGLSVGMILQQNLLNRTGLLIVAKGAGSYPPIVGQAGTLFHGPPIPAWHRAFGHSRAHERLKPYRKKVTKPQIAGWAKPR